MWTVFGDIHDESDDDDDDDEEADDDDEDEDDDEDDCRLSSSSSRSGLMVLFMTTCFPGCFCNMDANVLSDSANDTFPADDDSR